jgi:hypothetical protein
MKQQDKLYLRYLVYTIVLVPNITRFFVSNSSISEFLSLNLAILISALAVCIWIHGRTSDSGGGLVIFSMTKESSPSLIAFGDFCATLIALLAVFAP